MDKDPKDYPYVVTLRFKDTDTAEVVLHEIEDQFRTVEYNEEEIGENIYYVDEVTEKIGDSI